MSPTEYISQQAPERQAILTALHDAILANDKTVAPVVEPMMGKEMIIYKERAYMKYGLASVKNYMSIHCMPIYMNPAFHAKYTPLLPDAKFQKGCINFIDAREMSLDIAGQLFAECAAISIVAMSASRKKK
ncbi:hypothetical protein [Mucilaginibacter psychrotolerans]|uniref:DUF1801 domain-containing protein n=1 Tax=Mucilaginibacter psychrotolerans TaxID=1524096 RepID=A0A4Y8SF77_9SPHI|nr:hypothetical protein [Mucilaginibacter psychrotolerans]TFF37285.1 hypothetical protein E2R66_12680 [Mucilaginibacter psychrotolerans]